MINRCPKHTRNSALYVRKERGVPVLKYTHSCSPHRTAGRLAGIKASDRQTADPAGVRADCRSKQWSVKLLGEAHRTCLANYGNLDLTWISHLVLDAFGDFTTEGCDRVIIRTLGTDDHT